MATLSKRAYATLLGDLKRIIREGKQQAERAAAQELVIAYWNIGKRIDKEKLTTQAAYHNAILRDLSNNLDLDIGTLQRTVLFHQTYTRPPRIEGLAWTHYRLLLPLRDPDERAFYEQLAADEALSVKQLTAAIDGGHYESAQKKPRGKPFKLPRPKDPSYLYKAEVRDVVDADTLLLDIDLGFEVFRRQRLRLARIDAPERTSAKGKEGRRFVREQLAVAQTLVVRTQQVDIHGRYVAHIFYSLTKTTITKTFTQGRYLNQELINKGYAKPV